jgi:molybdate transport system ATP-binding protein
MARPVSPLVARLVGLRNIFTARIAAHDPGNAVTWIEWAGQRLECPLAQSFPVGSEAAWIVPASHILLHRRDRPSRGERENPVRAVIAEFLPLGENVSVRLAVANGAASLQATFPLHVARRNGLERGVEVSVSLLRDGIHLMHAGIPEMGSDSI